MADLATDFGGYNVTGLPGAGFDPGASSGGGGSNPFGNLFSGGNVGSTLGAGVAGAGLLYDILGGNQTLPQTTALQGEAGQLGSEATSLTNEGQGLMSYLTSGGLPPALQAQVNSDVAAKKAAITQQAANTTGIADPTKSSALTQDLNAAGTQGLEETFQAEQGLAKVGEGLISQGAQYAQLQNEDLIQLQKIAQQQQDQTGAAIAAFAGALGKLAFAA